MDIGGLAQRIILAHMLAGDDLGILAGAIGLEREYPSQIARNANSPELLHRQAQSNAKVLAPIKAHQLWVVQNENGWREFIGKVQAIQIGLKRIDR